MKGISPIIAIIIILLITIAIAGAGYSYIGTYWSSLTDKQIQVINSFCVDTGNQGKVMVKNIGTGSFETSEITVINAQTGEDISQDVFWSPSVSDSSLMLEMRFDEGSGGTTKDTSGQGNDGTLTGDLEASGWRDSGCRSGKCLYFDGNLDYVLVPHDDNLNPGTGSFTMSVWANPSALPAGVQRLLYKGDGAPWNGYYLMFSSTTFYSGFFDGTTSVEPNGGTASIGTWYFITAVRDKGSGNAIIYVDGNPVGTLTDGTADSNSVFDLYIGVNPGGEYFNGLMDEVRVYNRALTPDEIEAMANNAVVVSEGGTATFTHTCTGRCQYNLVLGGSAKEAMLEC